MKCWLIAGVVVAGVFTGFVAYRLVKKHPEALKGVKEKISGVTEKMSQLAADAKQSFVEGYEGATAETSSV